MAYGVGIVLSLSVAVFARRVGFDRDSHGAPGVNGDGGVHDCSRCRVQVECVDRRQWAGRATASLMPFTAMSWRTPECPCGGRPFVSRTTSVRQAALPGFSHAGQAATALLSSCSA